MTVYLFLITSAHNFDDMQICLAVYKELIFLISFALQLICLKVTRGKSMRIN